MSEAPTPYPVLLLSAIAELPAEGTWVLTVNNRLARRVVLELATVLRQTQQVSELPRVLPWSAWLTELADAGSLNADTELPAYRLDHFAAQMLWAEAIRAEEPEHPLLDTHQAARLALDADQLMDEWALHVPPGGESDEYRRFSRWRARYRERLSERDAEDSNQAYRRVLAALQAGQLAAPRRLILAGFVEISPRFAHLLAACAAQGTEIFHGRDAPRTAARARRVVAADQGAEWRAAAAWAADCLDHHPSGRYAIVSPQLESEVAFARRVLSQALAGQGERPAHAVNVAVGRPLIEWPLVRAALAWLRVLVEMDGRRGCAVEHVGAALLAGHCAGDISDSASVAMIDARWRRDGRRWVGQTAWQQQLSSAPVLAQAWQQAMALWAQGTAVDTCDGWAPRLKAALHTLGFPGETALDSVAYQTMGGLGEAFARFSTLTPVAGPLRGAEAVQLFERLLRATPFQPQRDPQARLDVLGLLEAEGGHWDGVWILGLSDEVLPAAPKPNPLLPLAVLRHAQAPRATPEREREWAIGIYKALGECAPDRVVSHAHREGERELRPSPLIADLALWEAGSTLAACVPSAPLCMETLQDERGPVLQPSGRGGGLDVLDTQARNPLWAFVRHRLGGRAMASYATLASARLRGEFLHRALELTWRMLSDQEALHTLQTQGRVAELLAQAVALAAEEKLFEYSPALQALECARAVRVLAAWLEQEAQRLPFQVQHVEQDQQWQRGPLTLTLRLDRIDVLDDGCRVIVDYKTGAQAARPEPDWSRRRPVNVQLPFYASVLTATSEAPVGGLVLAQIHAKQVAAQGLAEVDIGLPGVKLAAESAAFAGQPWGDILQRWRVALEALADEYIAGHAANFAYRRDDLKYCDALPFLRLHLDEEDA